jgi:hypothetical protein
MSKDIKVDTRLINLYSKNATTVDNYPYMSKATFAFKNILKEEPDILYIEIGVLNAQIPNSFYNINVYNQVLKYKIGSGATETITISEGNYTYTTLITALKSGFSANGETNVNITFNKTNGKYTFTNTVNNFTFVSSGSTMLDILGFISTQNYTSSSLSLTAPYPLNLLGVQRIKVNSNYLATNTTNSFSMGISNTIASIPVNASSFGLITYMNYNSYSLLRAKTISTIDIELRDELDNLIDFNGIDWTMSLQLNIFRLNKISDTQLILQPILKTLQGIQKDFMVQQTMITDGQNNLVNIDNQGQDGNIDNQGQDYSMADNLGDTTNFNTDAENDLDFLLYEGVFPPKTNIQEPQ